MEYIMKVYKYRGGDQEKFDRDLKSLKENYFYAPSFKKLNDPCETFIFSEKFKDQSSRLTHVINPNAKANLEILHTALENVIKRKSEVGIYSLSTNYKDELLWAHYAHSHKGFCIEFELEILLNSHSNNPVYHFPVHYSKNPPEFELTDMSTKEGELIVRKLLGYKSKRWEYETEYRIITQKNGNHLYDFKSVSGIYFGLRMDDNQKRLVMETLKGRGIKYYQIVQLSGSYLFEREQLIDPFGDEISYLSHVLRADGSKVRYSLTDQLFENHIGKGQVNVELEKELTSQELKELSKQLRETLFPEAQSAFIAYRITGQLDQDMAWAATNFEGDQLNIFINEFVRLPGN